MEAQVKLGRIFGIQIGLHYSWLIIAVLISLSLSNYFSGVHPDWSRGTIWTIAIATAILFFVAIILHELSHATVAKMRGLPVSSITLFALGGVAQLDKEPEDPKTEFWMAIAGPIASVVIGAVCLGLAWTLGWTPPSDPVTPLMAMLVWLGYINFALAFFNTIPSYPMDGGRVLRAIVWWFTGNANRATRAASLTGQFVAFGFIFSGLWQFFSGAGFGGLWMAFIGWFLLTAAKASYVQVELKEKLGGVSVGDLMSRDCPVLDSNENLQTFVDDHLLRTGQRCFMVVQNGEPVGLITPNEIAAVERRLWAFKTTIDAMRPIESLFTVAPEMPAIEALEIIGREGVNQLPVVENGKLKGIISREQIINYLFTREQLNL
ncbi:MAG: site-2 protease family protein [Acidobacteria bacterium]|nr:site-2 protease family protein [Acidobacteriota bacterium]